MLVRSRMAHPAITIGQKDTVLAAAEKLRVNCIRSLPVVDSANRLIGMISEKEIAEVGSNPRYLANPQNFLVEEVMKRDVLTVTANTAIEEAARMITDYDVVSLPVIDDNNVVEGIITGFSMIRILLEMTAARSEGCRVTLRMEDRTETLMELLNTLYAEQAEIRSISTFFDADNNYRAVVLKIDRMDKHRLKDVIKPFIKELVDIR